MIEVDEGRMVQVLMNLMDNALRYTPEGGKITLKVAEDTPGDIGEEGKAGKGSRETGQIQLQVIDNGTGISPKDLPYVF